MTFSGDPIAKATGNAFLTQLQVFLLTSLCLSPTRLASCQP